MVLATTGAMLTLLLPALGATATPEEEVTGVVQAFYTAVNARDAAAVGQLITEPFFLQPDAFDEPQGRDEVLASLTVGTATPTFTPGEFTPEVVGAAAMALVPIGLEGGAPPGVEAIRAVFLLVRTEAGWQIMSLTHLFTLDPAGEIAKGVEQAVGAEILDPTGFLSESAECLGGDEPGVWLTRFHSMGLVAGPWGPEGAMVVQLASQLGEVTPNQPISGLSAPEEADLLLETGVGGALAACDWTFTAEDGSPHPCRVLATAGWMASEGEQRVKWCLFSAVLAPLEPPA